MRAPRQEIEITMRQGQVKHHEQRQNDRPVGYMITYMYSVFSKTTTKYVWYSLGIKYQPGMDTSLKTHHSYVSAIVHRPLLLYSLSNIMYMRDFVLWTVSAPAQSVRIYNDLMGQRTNTA